MSEKIKKQSKLKQVTKKKIITKKKEVTTNKKVKSQKSNNKFKIIMNKMGHKLKLILQKILKLCLKFLKRYWQLILMNIVIFILTVFIESIYIYNLKFLVWVSNTFLFVIIPSIIFTLIFKIKSKDIVVSIPILYIFFLIFLDFCTLRDLYGITSGNVDVVPSFIDALLVVFIFTFFEYITVWIVNHFQKFKKKRKKLNE